MRELMPRSCSTNAREDGGNQACKGVLPDPNYNAVIVVATAKRGAIGSPISNETLAVQTEIVEARLMTAVGQPTYTSRLAGPISSMTTAVPR